MTNKYCGQCGGNATSGHDAVCTSTETLPYDTVGQIMAYEEGQLNYLDTIDLFQHLVNTGLAWQLQGHYGRTAVDLIKRGLVTR